MNSPVSRLQIVRNKNGRLEIRKQAPKQENVKRPDRDTARVRPIVGERRR